MISEYQKPLLHVLFHAQLLVLNDRVHFILDTIQNEVDNIVALCHEPFPNA